MKFKIWKFIVLVFLLIIIAALAFAPTIAKNQLEKNSKEWVGRKLKIESLGLNYFTGTVRIANFTMYEADDKTPFVGFDSLIIDTEPYRLFSNELVIESFSLIGLQTYIIQEDTIFNFDDLIAFYDTVEDSVVEEIDVIEDTISIEEDPMIIEVSNIYLNARTLSYTDIGLDHETKMENLNFILPYVSWNAEGGSQAGVQFDLNEGGYFAANLAFNPDSNEYHADLEISNLDLSSYFVYVEQQLNISAFEGIFSSHIILDGNMNEVEKTIVTGNINLVDFQLDNLNETKVFGLNKLIIDFGKIDYYNNHYEIDSIILAQPFIDFELLKEGTNFDKLMKEVASTDAVTEVEESVDTTDEASSELYYAIHSFRIDNGTLDFKDYTTPEPFSYYLSAINMSANEITSDADWVETHLDMLLNKRGIMKVELGFNPNNPMDMDLDYVLTNFQLSDINIYSKMHTGYPFLYGEMFYYSDTKIRDGIIVSENKLKINDVELGDKVKGWKSIPIKFALFLLKDKNGDIILDVPVRGDLNDPQINVKKLVWTTFKNVIFKVASSPVDFLSGFAKIDPNDIKTIEFAYMDTVLSSHIEHQIDMLVKLERSKPGLKIQMVYFNDVKREKELIAIDELGKVFYDSTELNYKKDEDGFAAFIKKRTLKDSVSIGLDCMMLLGQNKTDSIFNKYSSLRFDKIDTYLHFQSDTTKIKLIPYKIGAPKNMGSAPMFEMKYSLEDNYRTM